jgi:hypothetical protein
MYRLISWWSYFQQNEANFYKLKADLLNFCGSVALAKLCAHYGKGLTIHFMKNVNKSDSYTMHLDTTPDEASRVQTNTHEIWKMGELEQRQPSNVWPSE